MLDSLYNELKTRGFSVDVGVVPVRKKDETGALKYSQLEVDFVVNRGEKRYYIQSALTVADENKRLQEINSLNRIAETFAKIVITRDNTLPWQDENGVQYVYVEDFLLETINRL